MSRQGSTISPRSQLLSTVVASTSFSFGTLTLNAFPKDARIFAAFTCILSLLMLAPFCMTLIISASFHLGSRKPKNTFSNLGAAVSLFAVVKMGVEGMPDGEIVAAVCGFCCCF